MFQPLPIKFRQPRLYLENNHWLRSILKSFRKQPLPVPNQGWTLIEIAAVSIVASILAAMAFPSMAGMQGRSNLKSTMSAVEAAFQEAQRNAIKKGVTCELTINPTAKTIGLISPTPTSMTGCLSTSISIPASDEIFFTLPTASTNIAFSYKGNTTVSETIVLRSNKTSDVRCLKISGGLGLMRSGYYDATAAANATTTADENKCRSSL